MYELSSEYAWSADIGNVAHAYPTTPVPRALLVGSASALAQMQQSLRSLAIPPQIYDTVVIDLDQPAPMLPLHEVELVLLSLPVSEQALYEQLISQIDRAELPYRWLPTVEDQLAGKMTFPAPGQSRANAGLDPCRLINRQPHPLHERDIADYLTGQRVLITGSGGSIGSELARIVARFKPSELLLVERAENSLFEIDREIGRKFPDLKRKAILHDVTQTQATRELALSHKPEVVFHAAAHKHVPMMEDHPSAAVENNFFGTRSIMDAAIACQAKRFVMISTDKAVNPSSVMGATKRLAELYIQHAARNPEIDTRCCMVRFGNVLGSACSVIPIWSRELEHGGPLSVTHPEMHRYFMTIPEAAGLVLQAGAFSDGGEVFLLDMGQPIRILDLAKRFLVSQGLTPDVDINIQIIGVRPGEKLYEELAYAGEDMSPTPHTSVHRWKTQAPTASMINKIIDTFDQLRDGAPGSIKPHPWHGVSSQTIHNALRAVLPEMVKPASAAG